MIKICTNQNIIYKKFLCILELLKSHIIDITEDAPDESGIINMASHITVSLNPTADTSRLEEISNLDLDDTPQAKDVVTDDIFGEMKNPVS